MGPHNAEDSINHTELSSEDVPAYQFTVLHDSSDEENDDIDTYELLPQFGEDLTDLPDVPFNAENPLTDESEEIENNEDIKQSNDSITEKQEEQMRADSINLDEERIEKIKLLMSEFALPKSSYPVWASNLSEEQWKPFLDAKLADQHSSDS